MNGYYPRIELILVIAANLAVIIYLLQQLIKNKDLQIEQLKKDRDAFKDELDNLTSRKRLRQTQNTEAGILDARAALVRAKLEMEAEDDRRAYVRRLIDRCTQTLGEIREGPYAYNPDTPCVQRESNNE